MAERAAEVVIPFPERDVVASFGAQRRELGAGGTPADDQHGARSVGWRRFRLRFSSEARADPAGVTEALHQLAVDALVEPDARPQRSLAARPRLRHDVGIGHGRPRHGDDVGMAGVEHGFGLGDIEDPPGVDDGEVGG